jgi:hypothetical protein
MFTHMVTVCHGGDMHVLEDRCYRHRAVSACTAISWSISHHIVPAMACTDLECVFTGDDTLSEQDSSR